MIWHLTEEATSAEIKNSINKSNAAMLAATTKAKTRKGKGKDKSKSNSTKDNVLCTNKNCGRCGHTNKQCWEKGGGKEGQAPDWWKKKAKGKKTSVNVAENTFKSDESESENYAMVTYTLPKISTALICTSDFQSEAHAMSNNAGTILNGGASRHFSLDHSKFLNYQEMSTLEPIQAADGWTFDALGRGDLRIELPNGNEKPTLITLKNAYYSPHMAFTLMSALCVDHAGFSIFIKGGTCTIWSSKNKVIGHIPEIQGLY